ncbi:MAG: alpha/beta hydrolase [Roseibacillus sp.]|jgi:acetyl esterase/lipase|nr:alpha/beta hydrolase fold domain-containing protein [Roseibacillus sp.]MDP7106931.1 alpha/beta hydrolase [Roseibacillus sp.]MDP7308815.1 alpha/beta hydrolase [Roseibacillus sp.]HJM62448.1 alpha/beta hydrolase [Roseibacillus sp.]|tara:strand:+ start:524 stop:1339 length:816 start_codon:yes stop_codon:yes gene_type:complete
MKRLLLLVLAWALPGGEDLRAAGGEYLREDNLAYRDENSPGWDAYMKERCVLDLYRPKGRKGFSTVVWFHGGGLRSGEKAVPRQLQGQGIAVVAVNYRLFPKVKCPSYIEDAAAAVAWTFRNIGRHGGDVKRIYVAGHSAGGYLTSMVGLDRSYLQAHGIDADRIAGLIPFSGHTITHFTPREERGIPDKQAVIDRFAPLFHVRDDAPALVLITGDRELEMLGRYEENAYLWRMMKVAGHGKTKLHELEGFNHGGMAAPAFGILLKVLKGR